MNTPMMSLSSMLFGSVLGMYMPCEMDPRYPSRMVPSGIIRADSSSLSPFSLICTLASLPLVFDPETILKDSGHGEPRPVHCCALGINAGRWVYRKKLSPMRTVEHQLDIFDRALVDKLSGIRRASIANRRRHAPAHLSSLVCQIGKPRRRPVE